ncbi:MAG: pimeloyl-ACP methyl ester carboxylesterase, partial [Myxococcota bacterium]
QTTTWASSVTVLSCRVLWTLLTASISAATPTTLLQSTSLGDVAYWDVGDPDSTDVRILLHGLPTSKELWVNVIDDLPEGRTVVVDLLDFGESSAVDPFNLQHALRAQAIDELRGELGINTFTLVAHDLGASVAIDYMRQFGDRVERLVLMSSPVYPDFEEPAVVALVRKRWIGMTLLRLMPRLLFRHSIRKGLVHKHALDDFQMEAFLRDYDGRAGKERMWQNLSWGTPAEMFADYPEVMADIAVPTLLIHGAQDPYIPLEHARRMDEDIPDSTLIIIEQGAHFLPIDTPAEVAAAISAFLLPPGEVLEEDAETGQ